MSGASRYLAGVNPSANQWVVVMSRPLKVDGEHQVSFARDRVPFALAIWQGAEGQRDGHKRVTGGWLFAEPGK